MLQVLKPQIVVADASNYKTIQTYWWKLGNKTPFHAIGEKGFLNQTENYLFKNR
jgi:competence protein ComEC